jgi:hypothetical protein
VDLSDRDKLVLELRRKKKNWRFEVVHETETRISDQAFGRINEIDRLSLAHWQRDTSTSRRIAMFQTLVMKQSHADGRPGENRISTGTAINVVLIAVVILVVIAFFWMNPFRVGEITVATPNGPSMTFKVADSNDITDLIQKGLENEKVSGALTNSLLSIIEKLPPGSKLGEKLLELAERRRSPFSSSSVPARLVYDPEVPQGLAAVCENSAFLAKNIVIFLLGNEDQLLHTPVQAYADVNMTFPCPAGAETVRLNSKNLLALEHDKVMVKRNL